MKKILLVLAIILLVNTLIISSCTKNSVSPATSSATASTSSQASIPSAKPIEMKFASFFPVNSAQDNLLNRFCQEIEKRTEGRVKITFYPGGSLLDSSTICEGLQKNIANIAFVSMGLVPGRFPIMESFNQPVGYASAWVSNHSTDDVWRKFQPKEFDDYHVLFWNNCGPQCIWSTTPLRTLEDLKGKRIRGVGTAASIVDLLGGVPVGTPTGECYDAISKHVLDGVLMPFEAGKTWKFAEVCKYITQMWSIGLGGGFFCAVNKDSWGSLPLDIQGIFDDVGLEWVEQGAEAWNQADIDGWKYSTQMSVEFINPPPEESARWKDACKPYIDNYVKSMVAKGYSEQDIRGVINYFVERNEYWLQEQIKRGIKSASGPDEILIK